MAKRWSELSSRNRKLIVIGGVIEGILKAAMLADLRRRPASQIRGHKWLWVITALINSAGIGSIAYFTIGRRHGPADTYQI